MMAALGVLAFMALSTLAITGFFRAWAWLDSQTVFAPKPESAFWLGVAILIGARLLLAGH